MLVFYILPGPDLIYVSTKPVMLRHPQGLKLQFPVVSLICKSNMGYFASHGNYIKIPKNISVDRPVIYNAFPGFISPVIYAFLYHA